MLIAKAVEGVPHMTTRDVLRSEAELIERAMDGRATATPLIAREIASADLQGSAQANGVTLSDEQSQAALAILSSPNRYQLVQGDAGSGKTTLFGIIRDVTAQHGHGIVALTTQHRLACQRDRFRWPAEFFLTVKPAPRSRRDSEDT